MKQNYYKDDCKEQKSFRPSILSPVILKDIQKFEVERQVDRLKPKFDFSECKTWNVYKLSDICSCNMGKHNNGNYGDVWSYKCECEYVIKLDRNGYNCNEVNHHIKMAELGVAPPLYEVWRCINDSHQTKATILIMKKLDKTLLEWMESTDVNQEELIFSVFSKLEEKVRLMHSNNVIHYDLKADNIMIDKNEPYIIDFGLSKPIEEHINKTNINKLEYQNLADDIFRKHVFQKLFGLNKLKFFILKMTSYLPDQDRLSQLFRDESPLKQSPLKKSSLKKSPLKQSPLKQSPLKQSPLKHLPLKQSPPDEYKTIKELIQKIFDIKNITTKDDSDKYKKQIIESIIKKNKHITEEKAKQLFDEMKDGLL